MTDANDGNGAFPPIEEIQVDDIWSVVQGEHDGHLLIARVNDGAVALVGHPAYANRVGVAIPLEEVDEGGMPSPDEMESLEDIEEHLQDALTKGNEAILVLAITCGGVREYVFYSSDPAATVRHIEKIAAETTSHAIQHYVEPDADWEVYEQFTQ